ncbi:hypothetical protein [Roseibium sp.]|uniref:hypothetical protein n=1 Tax=Roseibium sp. TaxID=1936156 RepID=UPI003A97BFD6
MTVVVLKIKAAAGKIVAIQIGCNPPWYNRGSFPVVCSEMATVLCAGVLAGLACMVRANSGIVNRKANG